MSSRGSDCSFPFTELDVTESIGRNTRVFRPLTRADDTDENPGFWAPTRTNFLAGMNSNARRRRRMNRNCPQTPQNEGRVSGNFQPDNAFHTYGVY